jgi:hypothetical protein
LFVSKGYRHALQDGIAVYYIGVYTEYRQIEKISMRAGPRGGPAGPANSRMGDAMMLSKSMAAKRNVFKNAGESGDRGAAGTVSDPVSGPRI